MLPTSVLATVTGRDRPGVTAAFFAALAAHDVEVRDVEQVVIRDRLVLTVLFDLRGDTAALRNSVSRAAGALGMECEIAVADQGASARPLEPGARSHVIVLGSPLRPGVVSSIAQRVADMGGNIETVTQLSSQPTTALEMLVRTDRPRTLRAVLVEAADDTGVDIAVESAGLHRRAKRLVLLNADSTVIQPHGSAQAMRDRVPQLAGLPENRLDELRAGLSPAPDAAAVVATLRRFGYYVGLVSDGFTTATEPLVDQLGIDFVAANELEVADGRLTGRIVGPVLDSAGKADALRRFAAKFGVPLSQTVAVGSGADDISMLETAGLGIAFNAKSALRAAADPSIGLPYLDSVLFVLGVERDEPDRSEPGE
jgi:phosphoserine phosphatase